VNNIPFLVALIVIGPDKNCYKHLKNELHKFTIQHSNKERVSSYKAFGRNPDLKHLHKLSTPRARRFAVSVIPSGHF